MASVSPNSSSGAILRVRALDDGDVNANAGDKSRTKFHPFPVLPCQLLDSVVSTNAFGWNFDAMVCLLSAFLLWKMD